MNEKIPPIVLENEHRFDPTSDPLQWYSKLRLASSKMYFSSEEIAIQVAGGPWTQNVKMPSGRDIASLQQLLMTSDFSQTVKLPVLFTASPALGRFWRSTEVRLLPPAMLVNTCDRALLYRQSGSISKGWQLPPHSSVPLLWERADGPKFMQLKFPPEQSQSPIGILSGSPPPGANDAIWSGQFSVERIENFSAKVRRKGTGEYEMVSISVKMDGFVRYIIFRPYETHSLIKIRFLNNTRKTVSLQQEGCEYSSDPVEPGGELNFEWDEPHHEKKRILLKASGSRAISFAPETIARPVDLQLTDDCPCTIAAATHLYSRVIVLAPRMQHNEIRSLFPWAQGATTPSYAVDIQVNGFNISASLIDPNSPVEVGQLTLLGSKIVVQRTGASAYKCVADIGKVQLDNHLYHSPFPVMVSSLPSEQQAPAVRFSCDVDFTDPKVRYFGEFNLQAQTMEVGLDDVIIFRLASVLQRLVSYLSRSETSALDAVLIH